MTLANELLNTEKWVQQLPKIGVDTLGGKGAPIFILDFIMIGALKRTLSLASGIQTMVKERNMVCARAMLRMHLDTVSRILAYTYVSNPEDMAKKIIGGTPLNNFKATDNQALRDAYLVERMSKEHPWVSDVYKSTSGYVHFSESQFFDSIQSVENEQENTFQLAASHIDSKYPEDSWIEVTACFNHLTEILVSVFTSYKNSKNSLGQ